MIPIFTGDNCIYYYNKLMKQMPINLQLVGNIFEKTDLSHLGI